MPFFCAGTSIVIFLPPKVMTSVMRTPMVKADTALKISKIFFRVAADFRANPKSDGFIKPIIKAMNETGNRMKTTKKLKMMSSMNIVRHKK